MGVVGGALFAISFFWFGWTSYPSISFWAPMLSGGCLGLALTLTFVSLCAFCSLHRLGSVTNMKLNQLSLFNYIVDSYLPVVASALAANTVCRSAFGASFPVRFLSSSCMPFLPSRPDAYLETLQLTCHTCLPTTAFCHPDVRNAQSPLGINTARMRGTGDGTHSYSFHTLWSQVALEEQIRRLRIYIFLAFSACQIAPGATIVLRGLSNFGPKANVLGVII